MSQKVYFLNDKKFFEIWLSKRNPKGGRLRRKTKFDNNGKRIASKQVADRVEYELKKQLERTLNKNCFWTWENWHQECLRRMRMTFKESTTLNYDGGLTKWLPSEWCKKELSDMKKNDVFELIFNSIANKNQATKNIQKNILKRIKRIFEMAIEDGILTHNPALGIKIKAPPGEKKVLNSNEANLLLKAGKDCEHRFYYHWAFALFTGMRNGEIYALRWTDIDFETGLISLTKQWTSKDGLHHTKSYKNRVVPISKELKKLLLELKEKGPFYEKFWVGMSHLRKNPPGHPKPQGPEFDDLVLPRLTEWRHGEQSKILRSFCKNLGITEVKFHDLRATFITGLLAQGVPLVKVMAIVGHTEMSTTNEYLRLAGVDIKDGTIDRLGYYLHDNSSDNIVELFSQKNA